jgi:retron-type reverse transcriptase
MSKSLLEKVRSSDTLGKAWAAVRKNGRISKSKETREEVAAFDEKAFEKLNRIQRQLNTLKFKFSPAKGKKIPKKKKTQVSSPGNRAN